jgi:hypothetical protein
MELYSWTLALALGATAIALACAVVLVFIRRMSGANAIGWVRRGATGAAWIALALLAVSSLSHYAMDHRTGAGPAPTPLEFVRQHPAFVVVALLTLAALLILRTTRSSS